MPTDPLALESAVKEYRARTTALSNPTESTPSPPVGLVAGLITDFGLGNEPVLRRRLYERLQRLVETYGQKVELLIAEKRSIAKHPTTRMPGNYFARAITIALRENGLV